MLSFFAQKKYIFHIFYNTPNKKGYENMKKYNNCIIDPMVQIGNNVIIKDNNVITGNTIIADNAIIGFGNYINNSIVGENCSIEYSYITESKIGASSKIGPYSRLRPNTTIGNNCKIGNFVEIKNAKIGNNVKASHLSYIGDAEIGDNCNIGCGAIFVNYNGKKKHKTIVENNCFIGSNVNIIAPVTIKEGTYICAGTTITCNTEPNDFVIGRAKETIKQNKAIQYLKK